MKCSLTSPVNDLVNLYLVDSTVFHLFLGLSNLQHHGTQHGTANAHGEGIASEIMAEATMLGQKFALHRLEILREDTLKCQDLFGTQEALLVGPVHGAWWS